MMTNTEHTDCPTCGGYGMGGHLDDTWLGQRYCKPCQGTGKRLCDGCRENPASESGFCADCTVVDDSQARPVFVEVR